MGRHQEGKTLETTGAIGFLWPHHRSMARDLVSGMTPSEVAVLSGFTPTQVSRIIQSPLFIAELNRLTAQADVEAVDVHADLRAMSRRAIEVLDENLHSAEVDRGLKTKTAFDVLDRAGYAKQEKPQQHLHLHAHEVRKVEEMDKAELYDDIMDLVEGEE